MLRAPRQPVDLSQLSAHDRVYRSLRTQVMHGELAPGQALTLRGIGQQFGVSMTPAREAVQRLVAEGALSCRGRAGWRRRSSAPNGSRSWPRSARCWNRNWAAAPCPARISR
jgi:DNA-binding GntR family transcriptional regulator